MTSIVAITRWQASFYRSMSARPESLLSRRRHNNSIDKVRLRRNSPPCPKCESDITGVGGAFANNRRASFFESFSAASLEGRLLCILRT